MDKSNRLDVEREREREREDSGFTLGYIGTTSMYPTQAASVARSLAPSPSFPHQSPSNRSMHIDVDQAIAKSEMSS